MVGLACFSPALESPGTTCSLNVNYTVLTVPMTRTGRVAIWGTVPGGQKNRLLGLGLQWNTCNRCGLY